MSMEQPECSKRECKHWVEAGEFIDPLDEGVEGTVPVCRAFLKGIPDDVAWGDNLHLRPIKGDHGIQFEKSD